MAQTHSVEKMRKAALLHAGVTAERIARAGGVDAIALDETMAAGVRRARVRNACPLDFYRNRALIDDRQHTAGARLREEAAKAIAAAHTTGGYGQRIAGAREFSEMQVAARQVLLRVQLGVGMANMRLLMSVCHHDEWASGDLPQLRLALDALGDHWGMPREV